MRAKAAAHGRKIRFGIRLHVIVRETNDEAWQAAERLISHLDDETIAKAQAAFARTDSVGQQRMAALHNGKRDNLEISPNLWAGVGLVRGGAGTALVGDGPTVAARINEYAALGIDSFVLSGYPHLEEAYRVGELLFPLLDVAIPEIPQPQPLNPQGEAVANDFIPVKSRKAKEEIMATPVKKWLLRVALVFTGGHRGGVATGLLGWLAVDAYFAFTGRSGDGVLDALRQRRTVAASGDQLWRALIGFSIGGSLGLILGLISGLSRWGERLLDTSIQMLRNVPHLALIPLVILWFGIDESAKIFLVALGTLFPIYINTAWHP